MVNSSPPPVYGEHPASSKLCSQSSPRKIILAALIFVCLTVSVCQAQTPERRTRRPAATTQTTPTGIDQEKQEAVKTIPWNELSTSAKSKIKGVISAHSIFRRLPQQRIFSDPEMYNFLVEHPDVVVAFWEKLGVTEITLRETKDGRFLMKETTGTTAVAEILYRTKDICIVHGRGRYLGPFLAKAYEGEAVLVLRSRFQRDANNEPYVVCDLDAFVRIDNVGADLFARLFATSLGKIADSNFEQTVAFVSHVSEASAINPETVKNLSTQLNPVREEVRDDFGDVVDRVALRHIRRNGPTYYFVEARPSVLAKEAPYTAYTSDHQPLPSAIPFPIPQTPQEPYGAHPIYGQTPSEHLFTYENVAEKVTKNHEDLPQLSSFAVIREEPPAPLESQESSKPLPIPVPALKGRVVFGTPKITQSEATPEP